MDIKATFEKLRAKGSPALMKPGTSPQEASRMATGRHLPMEAASPGSWNLDCGDDLRPQPNKDMQIMAGL